MIEVDDLPGELAEIAGIIGIGRALRLAADFGGTEIYVPKRMSENHPVARSIGLDAAKQLADSLFGGKAGGRLDVPRAAEANRRSRNAAIIQDVRGGMSKEAAALRYRLTTRQVRAICNGENDDRQGELF